MQSTMSWVLKQQKCIHLQFLRLEVLRLGITRVGYVGFAYSLPLLASSGLLAVSGVPWLTGTYQADGLPECEMLHSLHPCLSKLPTYDSSHSGVGAHFTPI